MWSDPAGLFRKMWAEVPWMQRGAKVSLTHLKHLPPLPPTYPPPMPPPHNRYAHPKHQPSSDKVPAPDCFHSDRYGRPLTGDSYFRRAWYGTDCASNWYAGNEGMKLPPTYTDDAPALFGFDESIGKQQASKQCSSSTPTSHHTHITLTTSPLHLPSTYPIRRVLLITAKDERLQVWRGARE